MSETWPQDADAVVRWIRSELTTDAEFSGLDDIRISADIGGDDLSLLTMDATGAHLTTLPSASSKPSTPEAEVRSRRAGIAREIRVIAAPVHIAEVPLTIDAEVRDAPIDWVEYERSADAALADDRNGIRLRDGGRGMSGSLTFSMRTADVEPLIERVMRTALETGDARVRRLRVGIHQDGADGARIIGSAAVRYKLLFASVRGEACVRVTRDGVLTIEDLRASSRNPLVALALRVARRSIRDQIGRRIDLNEEFGLAASGPRLHDVRVRIDRDLHVEARLG
ncbi:hypothetical protein ACI3KS_18845 [Microbacterium sp. ZW T5_45]|uniref:hypothetical protein n=1 Tax=Microbacterium sp. ZW T5_45 TaxID=3378080 RepID=UPI003852ABE8